MIDKNKMQRLKFLCNTRHASNIKKRFVIDFTFSFLFLGGGALHIFYSTNALAPELWPALNRCEKLQKKTKEGKYIFAVKMSSPWLSAQRCTPIKC